MRVKKSRKFKIASIQYKMKIRIKIVIKRILLRMKAECFKISLLYTITLLAKEGFLKCQYTGIIDVV